ncbi:MAG: peptidoglycan DD-metalloendopeptidase family protein [Rhizobiales bacterium]|nr:peptidoglycan DD-metalloendopeptidase family protein [Hyphomicrobiales bacterium]
MRNLSCAFRIRLLNQVAVVAILAGATAACSGDVTRLREPLFTGSTPNQRQIIGQNGGGASDADSDLVQPGPASNGVQSADLAPPAMPTPMTPAPIAVAPAQPQPSYATNYTYQAAGGRVVTVGKGESLETLALKYGAPVAEIAKANQIHSPADLKPGKVIVIPTRVAMAGPAVMAPVAAPEAYAPAAVSAPAQAEVAKVGGGMHVVEPGQTLYSLARQYHTRPAELAAANGLTVNTSLRVGQKLRIPGTGDAGAKTQLVAYSPAAEQPASLGTPPKPLGKLVVKGNETSAAPAAVAQLPKQPAIPAAPTVAAVPPAAEPIAPAAPVAAAPAAAPAPTVADTADPPSANGTSFRWPVRGRIISAFGSKPNGEKNDGINLAVPEGTSVKAAEAGTVIYAGNELAGYGNLVLIRHADGWVTAYAHNSEILVKRGDKVARGQIVGKAGMSGSVNAPQVHFELRKGAKPVNPLDYLAG